MTNKMEDYCLLDIRYLHSTALTSRNLHRTSLVARTAATRRTASQVQSVRTVAKPNPIVSTDAGNNPVLRYSIPHTEILPRHPQPQSLARAGRKRARLLKVPQLDDRCVEGLRSGKLYV
jgi:hypothetical protein